MHGLEVNWQFVLAWFNLKKNLRGGGRGEGMECSLKQKRLAFPRTDEAMECSATWCPHWECGRFQGTWREAPAVSVSAWRSGV